MNEQINIMLQRCISYFGYSRPVDEVRVAGVIEGILIAVGDITLDELYEYRIIEVENPSVATIFLPKKWIKQTIIRKEKWVEYMKRRAKEYLNKQYSKENG